MNHFINDKKQNGPLLVNNKAKFVNHVPTNELFTSTSKFNGSVEGLLSKL